MGIVLRIALLLPGGNIGAEAAAKSPPDGYTLFFGTTGTLASVPALQSDLRYDPVQDAALASGGEAAGIKLD